MQAAAPIFLFTDFGANDIYVGQVKAKLNETGPGCPVFDLLNDAAPFAIKAGAHLLAALARQLPAKAVTVAVVDPGVGGVRDAIAVEADARWYVGPDNGLMSVLAARAKSVRLFSLRAPAPECASFHGRDLFAPAAAEIAVLSFHATCLSQKSSLDVQLGAQDLPEIIYIDHYGNALTGLRASVLNISAQLVTADRAIPYARVFSAVRSGELFWYENSIGLVEIAANQASARSLLGLEIGQAVLVRPR